jgi:pSer/pThr/pTyr-binding forkhead associated (FHA) protein
VDLHLASRLFRNSIRAMNEPESALELFRNACGLTAPLVLEWAQTGQGAITSSARAFAFPFVLMGRDEKADLVLDSGQTSRRHAFLQVIGGRSYVVDLESRTKVLWEGEETPRSQGWLDPDRFIQVGPYRIRRASSKHLLAEPAEHVSRLNQEQIIPSDLPKAALELPIRMGEKASLWPLEGPFILVGRIDQCQLVLTDESVSKFHASLVLTPSGVWVVDLLSREGVHVNGTRVRWAWLDHGDSLQFGRLSFNLRYDVVPDRMSRELVPLEAGASPIGVPGTELAIRHGVSTGERTVPALRPGTRSLVLRNGTSLPERGESATLIPFAEEGSQHAIQYSPHPTLMWHQQMQMMESFHNDMIMMVQMFVAMHREHLASMRDELDRVQQLTRELTDLRATLAQPSRSADVGLAGAIETSAQKRGSVRPQHARNWEKNSNAQDSKNASGGAELLANKPDKPALARKAKTASAKEIATPEPEEAFAEGESQVHMLLTERIANLQRERQGYWQRILSALHN